MPAPKRKTGRNVLIRASTMGVSKSQPRENNAIYFPHSLPRPRKEKFSHFSRKSREIGRTNRGSRERSECPQFVSSHAVPDVCRMVYLYWLSFYPYNFFFLFRKRSSSLIAINLFQCLKLAVIN